MKPLNEIVMSCDIDSVCNNLTEAVLSVYNEDYNDNLKIEDIIEYNIEKFVKPEARENFYLYFTDKRTWKRIKPINVEAIQWLIDNTKFYFVTSTESENIYKKHRWLGRIFKNINLRKRLIRCYDKQLIKADYLIDDGKHNLEGGSYEGICIAYPWNRDYRGRRYGTVAEFVNERFSDYMKLTIQERKD